MTEQSPVTQFCDAWAQAFAHVLSQLNVASPSVTASEPLPAAALSAEEVEKTISVYFHGAGALKGEQIWVAEPPGALQLAQTLLAESLDPSAEFSPARREAFTELLRQVAQQVATSWKEVSGADVQIVSHEATGDVFVPARCSKFTISGPSFPEIVLRLFVNSAFLDSLIVESPSTVPSAEPVPDPAQIEISVVEPAHLPAASRIAQNLELLQDVTLEATIRFGEKELRLREILALVPGETVELNQMVSDPAELFVAGRCVARGEVVVVDGNFGLRITEVASLDRNALTSPSLPRKASAS